MTKFDDPKIVALLRRGLAPSEAQKIYDRENATPTIWQPNTFYSAGTMVITPGGYLASAKADFTSGGTYSPANWNEYTPGAELAYAENITGTTQVLSTASTDVTGCVITVPQTPRPTWIEGFAMARPTTAPAGGGSGTVALVVVDDQATPVTVGGNIMSFEGGSGTSGAVTLFFRARIAPNTPSRTYKLQANRGGQTWAGTIYNGAIGIAFRSYIAAYSG